MKNLLLKLKEWFNQKALPWLASILLKIKPWFVQNWFIIANYFIIFVAYSIIYGVPGVVIAEVLLGLWLFFSVAYAGYKWFMKPKKAIKKPIIKKAKK
jgi:hypothetical protein